MFLALTWRFGVSDAICGVLATWGYALWCVLRTHSVRVFGMDRAEYAEDIPDPGLPPRVAAWFAESRAFARSWRGDPGPADDETAPPG